jgi:subtilisin family serine protease
MNWYGQRFVQCCQWILTAVFVLLCVSQAQSATPDKKRLIKWRGHKIVTNQPLRNIPAKFTMQEYPSTVLDGYYMVQFKNHISKTIKQTMKTKGAEMLRYVPNNASIVRMSAAEKETVSALANVQYVGIYQPAHRIAPNLMKRFQGQPIPIRQTPQLDGSKPTPAPSTTEPVLLTILVFKDEDLDRIKMQITDLGGTIKSSKRHKKWDKIRVIINLDKAQEIPLINGVMWVEEYGLPELTNDVARGIMNVADAWAPVNGMLRGAGQIVAVADSGLDSGVNNNTLHDDFQGRITAIHSWPVQGLGIETNVGADDGASANNYGHGTHTAGSAVGDGTLSGGTYSGVAPDANLVFQAIQQFSDYANNERDRLTLTGVPGNFEDLFQEAYDDGARIHSNSWGRSSNGAYTVGSEEIDQFVWDHPDMLILFSAGNGGRDADQNNVVDLGSLNEQATAKNCLTVGATENDRAAITTTWSGGYGNNINQDLKADNEDGMAAFSSRGPANNNTVPVNDDRIKPDVVAPGTMVVSARTRVTQNVPFTDDVEGGVGTWVAGGTWARTNAQSHAGNWSWNDGSVGNYANNTNVSLTSAQQNLNNGGVGNKYLQFWCRYDLGTGDMFRVRVMGDGGSWIRSTFQGDQNGWELMTFNLGPRLVNGNWYNFSDAPDFQIEFSLESDNDGNNGDGVFIDDIRIVEGPFVDGLLSDFGLAAAGSQEDDNYVVMGGTSMSTPLTAGAAAIVRQYYQDEIGMQYMSGALLRATLINGAEDITPGQYGAGANQEIGARPNNVEGWGRVDLRNTLFSAAPSQLDFRDELAGLETGEQHEYKLNIVDNTVPAVITMVYHDAPGANLINHLDMTIKAPGAGGATLFPNGLAAVDDQNNVEQIEIQNPQLGEYTITIDGQNVNIGPQPYALVTRAGGVMADRDPIDIMLALDISGSMQDPAAPGGDSKLLVLQQAVELFVQLWTAVAAPEDRMGIAYFKTQVDEYKEGGVVLLDVIDNAGDFITDVNAQTTNWSASTAMGGGLQQSINRLTDVNRFRNIILFTDGMQNVNPMVMDLAGGNYKIDQDPTKTTNSNVNPTNPVTQLDNNLDIKINTIGVGATDPYMDLMDGIAASTNGLSKLTQAPDADLRRFFVEDLVDALREHSPQLIGYRHGLLNSSGGAVENFMVGKNAQKVILKVSGKATADLKLEVFKDKKKMTYAGKLIKGAHYQIFSIDMPYKYKMDRIKAEGMWTMQISGNAGAKYEVAAIVDEPLLECEYNLDQKDYAVGEALGINVRLKFGNRPVTDATVTATVLRPKCGIGTLLSTTDAPNTSGSSESGISADLVKFQQLLKQQKFYTDLQPAQQNITLHNNGNGIYTANFTNTNVPGTYTIKYNINGSGADIGFFYRTETRSTLVRFGAAELAQSAPMVELVETTATENIYLLVVRPKDKHGNYMGPGYKNKVVFTVDGNLDGPVMDLLDGRYSQKVRVALAKEDPDISISVMGQSLYSGPMSGMKKGKKWGLSLHGGIALPQGNLSNDYNAGLMLMGDLSYRLSSNWDLVGYVGYNAFSANTTGIDDVSWINISLDAKFRILEKGMMPYLQAGLGYYIPNTGDGSLGANLGLGLDIDLTDSLVLELGGDYHLLFGNDSAFIQGHGGVVFRF